MAVLERMGKVSELLYEDIQRLMCVAATGRVILCRPNAASLAQRWQLCLMESRVGYINAPIRPLLPHAITLNNEPSVALACSDSDSKSVNTVCENDTINMLPIAACSLLSLMA